MDEDKVESKIEEVMEFAQEFGDDTRLFTQEESAEFYDGVAMYCKQRSETIRSEMT